MCAAKDLGSSQLQQLLAEGQPLRQAGAVRLLAFQPGQRVSSRKRPQLGTCTGQARREEHHADDFEGGLGQPEFPAAQINLEFLLAAAAANDWWWPPISGHIV